jgi:hypothetical protein
VYRVIPYVGLMRDEYPPFRLDMGEREPGGAAPLPPPPPPGPGASGPPPPTGVDTQERSSLR